MYCLPEETPSTMYEDPFSLGRTIRTVFSHFLLMWHCISARLPVGSSANSFVLELRLSVLALLIVSLYWMHFDPLSVFVASIGSLSLWMCPKKELTGRVSVVSGHVAPGSYCHSYILLCPYAS